MSEKVAVEKNAEPNDLEADLWMVRDCDDYYDEYKECKSIKGRFHQYFIYGETLDCNQWKKDYDNCQKLEKSKDYKAGRNLIDSEKCRRAERLKGHFGNTVWKKRDGPPEDWNKPLPPYMEERNKNSYLAFKAEEIRKNPEAALAPDKNSCVVM